MTTGLATDTAGITAAFARTLDVGSRSLCLAPDPKYTPLDARQQLTDAWRHVFAQRDAGMPR